MTDSTHEFFKTLARILPRCWIFGFVLLFIWLGAFLSGAVHNLHGPLMDLTDHDLNVIHYRGMAFLLQSGGQVFPAEVRMPSGTGITSDIDQGCYAMLP